jgi:hypothetical protein
MSLLNSGSSVLLRGAYGAGEHGVAAQSKFSTNLPLLPDTGNCPFCPDYPIYPKHFAGDGMKNADSGSVNRVDCAQAG